MNLYLLRHGIAFERGTRGYKRDQDRPLTALGIHRMERIARGMKSLRLTFDLILTSPYLRASQTAEIVARELGLEDKLEESEHMTPDGSLDELIAVLAKRSEKISNILIVGHEPYLSSLISLLTVGNTDNLALDLKKGGLCKLSAAKLKSVGRSVRLEWLLTSKHLRSIK